MSFKSVDGLSASRKVYRYNSSWLFVSSAVMGLIGIIVCALSAGVILASFVSGKQLSGVILLLVVVWMIMAMATYDVFSTYLAISSEGVEYHRFGYTVCTPWGNIERIGAPPLEVIFYSGSTWLMEGLVLCQPVLIVNKLGSRFSDRFIPLTCFDPKWRYSELGQNIKRYAPHLFDGKASDLSESSR